MKGKNKFLAITLVGGVAAFVLFGLLLAGIYFALQPHDCVGVIKIDGEIAADSSPGILAVSGTSSTDLVKIIDDAGRNGDIKAVLFEINSPGGSVVASREIYEAAKDLDKPKVMYFRETAASGAYYIASAGSYLVADPDALTGSIGVRATFSDLSGLFNKLGMNFTTVKSGGSKDMGDLSRPLTEKERAILQGIVDEIFGEFRQIVLDARAGKPRFTLSGFEEVLDGRVLTGRQAYALGLVDELGSKKTALRKAAALGGVKFGEKDEPRTCVLSSEKGFLSTLLGSFSANLAKLFSLTQPKSGVFFN